MSEAKRRNPRLSLDATAWNAPAWVGSFWSQDMADYYVSWLSGLREVYGMELDAVMQRCNIRLSNYVSNTDTKSYKDVVDALCKGVTDPEELIRKIHGRIVNKHGRETILASLTGVVSEAEKDAMRQLREELTLAERHKEECHQKMVDICKTYYPKEFARLMTIPGIKERAATSLIAEIGVDMTKFQTAAHLASWSGLKPRNDVSNGKFKSRRITHGNAFLRKTITECAWGSSRTKDCFFSRFSYRMTQVCKKNKMKVLVKAPHRRVARTARPDRLQGLRSRQRL